MVKWRDNQLKKKYRGLGKKIALWRKIAQEAQIKYLRTLLLPEVFKNCVELPKN